MNDAHDNAQTDKGMLRRFNTDNAIQAFQTVERLRLRLDQEEHRLHQTIGMGIDRERYAEQTEDILKEFEIKRATAAKRGYLPKG
jgi:hypothetical protein